MNEAIQNLISSGRVEKGMYWEKALRLVEGCQKVSPGCAHCWSERQAHLRSSNPKMQAQYGGVTTPDGKWNGKIKLLEQNLALPLKRKKPTVWAIWNDLFQEEIPVKFLNKAFDVMENNYQHIYLILTKRPYKMLSYLKHFRKWNGIYQPQFIYVGTTAENQEMFDKRWAFLKQIPAAVYMISYEPALGLLVLPPDFLALGNRAFLVCGGESSPGARPMHPDWARSLRDQCVEAGVPFFFKQWGEWGCDFPGWAIAYNNIAVFNEDDNGHEPVYLRDLPLERQRSWDSSNDPDDVWMYKVGKKAAGRKLDGQVYDQVPGRM